MFIGDPLVNDIPARARDVAMVFQNYALYPHKTVAQNIAFRLEMRKVDRKIIQERLLTVAQSLSLENLLDRKPQQLSGGQQQRVALERELPRQPQLFLLDEPLSNLDAQLRDHTRAELKQLQLGITTIYVNYDQVEAMTLADKIVVLSRGRIQQIGDPQSIYALPANEMVASFLGNPPMNIVPAIYKGNNFDISGQLLAIPKNIKNALNLHPEQICNLGIRPDHIYINVDVQGTSRRIPQRSGEYREEEVSDLLVEVKVIESLGRETLIRASLPDSFGFITVQVGGGVGLHPGERLNLQLDLDHLFLFEPSNGERIFPITSTVRPK